MPTPWQIESLTSRLDSLRLEIERVAEKDHPYPDPDTVYEALKLVIASRSSVLKQAVAEYPLGDKESERKLQDTLFTIASEADEVAELFSYADRVDSARIPFEILRSLSWVASSLLDQECHAVVRLDSDYNYTIVSCRQEFLDKEWQEEWSEAVALTRARRARKFSEDHLFDRALPRDYTVLLLGFPAYDASYTPLHALAAHELAHEICFRDKDIIFSILDRAIATATDRKHRLHSELMDFATYSRKPGGGGEKDDYETSVDQAAEKLSEFLNEWIVEIFSDLFAANLLGPTFLAAFDKLELRPYRVGKKHPPGRFRRSLVKRYLEKYLQHVIKDPVWDNLFKHETVLGPADNVAEDDDPLAPLYSIGEDICNIFFDELSEIIKETPSPLKDQSNLAELLKQTKIHFAHLSPPSATLQLTGTDADVNTFWLLIYAAWHFRFDESAFMEFAQTHAGGDKQQAEQILSSLLLTALESIEIRFLWERDSLERTAS